jgi:hypothetical protein
MPNQKEKEAIACSGRLAAKNCRQNSGFFAGEKPDSDSCLSTEKKGTVHDGGAAGE